MPHNFAFDGLDEEGKFNQNIIVEFCLYEEQGMAEPFPTKHARNLANMSDCARQ